MKWYKVRKKIHGRFYDYWQRTQRINGKVKTFNKYIGPSNGSTLIRMSLDDSELRKRGDQHNEKVTPLCSICGDAGHEARAHDLKLAVPSAEKALPFGLSKGRYFCKRCEKQTHSVNFDGYCQACGESYDSQYWRQKPWDK